MTQKPTDPQVVSRTVDGGPRIWRNPDRDRIIRGTVGTYGDILRLQIPMLTEDEITALSSFDRSELFEYYTGRFFYIDMKYLQFGYARNLTFSSSGFMSFDRIPRDPSCRKIRSPNIVISS